VKHLRRHLKREQGSVTVVVAIALVAIIGLVALGTDVGRLYLAKQRVAAAADAAALSGAQLLPFNRQEAFRTVQDYLRKNGVRPEASTVNLNDLDRTLAVTVEETVDFTFARVLGRDQATVLGGAVARVRPVSGYNNVVPLGVVRADWKLGDPVVLKASANSGQLSPGNYGALALGARGSASYENNLRNGYTGWIRAGNWLPTETGNMAEPTRRALQARIDLDTWVTYATVGKHSDRIVIIPMLESFEVNGRGEVKCIGFAAFFLEAVESQGNDKGAVHGRFLRYMLTGESDGTGSDFATYTIKLTR
jgi:Flp pilus assembly protein TadG